MIHPGQPASQCAKQARQLVEICKDVRTPIVDHLNVEFARRSADELYHALYDHPRDAPNETEDDRLGSNYWYLYQSSTDNHAIVLIYLIKSTANREAIRLTYPCVFINVPLKHQSHFYIKLSATSDE